MEQFNTLLEAAECVVTRCNSWRFATSDEKYDAKSLMGIAEVSDAENPADEDSFYVVSPGGAIGFCEDGEDVDWLFLTDGDAGKRGRGDGSFVPKISPRLIRLWPIGETANRGPAVSPYNP